MELSVYINFAVLCFSSFFSLINPLAAAPVFSSLTTTHSLHLKKKISRKASIFTAVALVIFVLVGELIFQFFGLTIHGFRIAGGILFFGMGINMLQAKDSEYKTTPEEVDDAGQKADFAITPLGIPMLCGPGAISNAMILSRDAGDLFQKTILIVSIALVSLLTYLILVGADRIVEILGQTGIRVLKRIMGLIVMVVAVEFIVAGTRPILMDIITQAIRQAG